MKILQSIQNDRVSDPVRSKFSMVAPILEATLYSISESRIARLGGYQKMTLWDVAREFRDGSGDAGICFEYSVHDALARQNKYVYALASEVIESFCGIKGGANSLLFGPEKDGRIPILESVQNSLTDDSVVFVGNRGRPPKLRKYIPQIIKAFRRNEDRNKLPRSINGLWKADLFIGNSKPDQWVGTTVKINAAHLQGAQGLRIAIYPKENNRDVPRKDELLNLIRLPLPYDGAFMELYYKSFNLVRAFMKADASVPPPVSLPDAEDRFITRELEDRREFPVLAVIEVIRDMAQPNLLSNQPIEELRPDALLSEGSGLESQPQLFPPSELISITPKSLGDL